MTPSDLDSLLKELNELREPPGGYDETVDRFSSIAVLDHERKTQYRRVVMALQMPDPITARLQLQEIEKNFLDYGQLIVDSAATARDLDGHGNVLHSAAPISPDDQLAFETRCAQLRGRVLDALLQSGYVAPDPSWLL